MVVRYLIFFLLSIEILAFNKLAEKYNFKYSKKLEKCSKQLNNHIKKGKTISISETTLKSILYNNGIFSYKVYPKTWKIDQSIDQNYLLENFLLKNIGNFNKVGISKTDKYFTTVLSYEPIELNISPLKKRYKQYQKLEIKGVVNSFKNFIVDLYIKTPSNRVKHLFLPIIDGKFNFIYRLKEKGNYIFELIDSSNNDPKIIYKFPINVGKLNKKNKICSSTFSFNDMLKHINNIRKKQNLSKLSYSKNISLISYRHSVEMAEKNYFSHISPYSGTPKKRLQNRDINFLKVLENISKSDTICAAYMEILDSPGHFNNILDPDINTIAIGIYKKKDKYYITQNFIQLKKKEILKNRKKNFIKQLKIELIKGDNLVIFDQKLSNLAKKFNNNQFKDLIYEPNLRPVELSNYKNIKKHIFILENFDLTISKKILDQDQFKRFGIDIMIKEVKDKDLIFVVVITSPY